MGGELAADLGPVLVDGAHRHLVEPQAASAANTAYAFAYFKETPNESGDSYALHLAVSTDGLNWTPLNQNNPVATPTAGTLGLRDPFILRKQDGTFVVLATDLNGTDFTQNNQYLHVWDSTNLQSFTGYRRVRMHGLNTHTWAPTAFWDAARGQYGIVYSANNGRDVFMVNYTTDFRTVSAAQVFLATTATPPSGMNSEGISPPSIRTVLTTPGTSSVAESSTETTRPP